MASADSTVTPPGPGTGDTAAVLAEMACAGTPVEELISRAGPDRRALETARDRLAARVHARVDDFEATGGLQRLNRALAQVPIDDPLDWKPRWGQRFRRP